MGPVTAMTAVPFSQLTWAEATWGRASSAPFTRFSQCSHIMPETSSIFSVSSPTGADFCARRRSWAAEWSLNQFSRRALLTTQKLERLMAAAPNMGLRVQPKMGIHTPAASGMPITL